MYDDIVTEISRAPLTLPAERNAFIITYRVLSDRRYRVPRDRERSLLVQRGQRSSKTASETRAREMRVLREQGDIRYPQPIEEFLDFLTDVELNAARPLKGARSTFSKLARAIETHIQGGIARLRADFTRGQGAGTHGERRAASRSLQRIFFDQATCSVAPVSPLPRRA